MKQIFFETKNMASHDFPYFSDRTKNINYLSHFHREIELVLVREGCVDILHQGMRMTAKQGDICAFMPGEIHSFSSPFPNHLYILKLDCRHSQKLTDCTRLRIDQASLLAGTHLNRVLWDTVEEMRGELTQKKRGFEYMVAGLSERLVGIILRFASITEINADESRRHLSAVRMLNTVNEYIESNYEKSITLDEIASQCNFSKFYFSHYFKEITGVTFYDYLTLFRLKKAHFLLLHSEQKISDIALDAGFSNIRSFNRAFKSAFAKTPTQYQDEIKRTETTTE